MADFIHFVLNDQPVELSDVSPMTTLLDWLRDHRGLKGTKEGCAEGDCGACTVVLERADGRREAMNSCIALLGQLDGQSVRTVEGLRPGKAPHPVQTAMAEADATQCGFCTPGFVMSAYAFAAGGEAADLETIHDALAGNLCRCTGYRPIVEAMGRIAGLPNEPVSARLPARSASAVFGGTFHVPHSLNDLLALRAAHPEALLLAGATDVGLLAGRARKPPDSVIHLSNVPELAALSETETQIRIGAAASYARAMPVLIAHYPTLKTYLARLGSRQIRTLGTLGGNIGTASPIGDMPPVLIALGATLTLASTRGTRQMPLEDFFLDYRKTALAVDEVIQGITIPKLQPDEVFFCDKLSKRRDQDISTVAAGYRLRIRDGRVEEARIAFGGMAATPRRARSVEAALLKEGFASAAQAVAADFKPIDDWRGTGTYRLQAAKNLLRRLALRVEAPAYALEVDAL